MYDLCTVLVEKLDSIDLNNNKVIVNQNQKEINCENSRKYSINCLNSLEMLAKLLISSETVMYDCDQLLATNINDHNINWNKICQSLKLIELLTKLNKKIIFTSNRSDRTRQQMLIQLKTFGINATIDQMFPTSYTTALYLKAIGFEREVFVVGSKAIEEELNNVHIRCTGLCSHSAPNDMNPGFATFRLNPGVGAVVVSFDQRIPLPHLVKACSYATKPDCLFIVANSCEDYTDCEPDSEVASIRVAANKGFISMAKPHKLYFNCIRKIHSDIDLRTAVIITDRLSTDITFGENIGIKTVFIETDNQYIDKTDSYEPDYFVDSLSTLIDLLT